MRLARVTILASLAACHRPPTEVRPEPDAAAPAPLVSAVPSAPAPAPEPVSVDGFDVPGDVTAYVLHGVKQQRRPIVFLGGMCVHPQGYVQSFAYAATEHGVAIGLQGDVPCSEGGGMTRWSYDVDRTDRRIDAAFAAAGQPPPKNAIAIGLSQGADLANRLAARWPEKYTSVILVAHPGDPSPHTARAVFMAGNYDIALGRMRAAAKRMGPAGLFIPIGNAYHGQLGPTPNASFARALDFVDPQ